MDRSQLNSPAQGARTENDSMVGDAAGMGGESGESSGSSYDEKDNQFKDPGVENAPPTQPTEQVPQLPPSISESVGGASRSRGQGWSTATSSNNRCHTSTHMTHISRPRNWQRENLPEGPGDRVGNVMVMMMMSQAQDRDKRQEEQ